MHEVGSVSSGTVERDLSASQVSPEFSSIAFPEACPAAGGVVAFALGVAPEGDLGAEDLRGLGRVVDVDGDAVVASGSHGGVEHDGDARRRRIRNGRARRGGSRLNSGTARVMYPARLGSRIVTVATPTAVSAGHRLPVRIAEKSASEHRSVAVMLPSSPGGSSKLMFFGSAGRAGLKQLFFACLLYFFERLVEIDGAGQLERVRSQPGCRSSRLRFLA